MPTVDADCHFFAPVDVDDLAYRPEPGQRQARLRERRGHDQRAGCIEFGAGQQEIDRALQAGEVGRAHAVRMGALHRQAGPGHEGHQHQRGAQQQARANGEVEPHPRVKR